MLQNMICKSIYFHDSDCLIGCGLRIEDSRDKWHDVAFVRWVFVMASLPFDHENVIINMGSISAYPTIRTSDSSTAWIVRQVTSVEYTRETTCMLNADDDDKGCVQRGVCIAINICFMFLWYTVWFVYTETN